MPEGIDSGYRVEIGRAIKVARKAQGMTQEDLRRRLGKTKTSVSNWERGASAPTVENLRALCQILHVEPGVLMGIPADGDGTARDEEPLRQPIEEIGARLGRLRRDAESSLPGLIDGLKDLEAEADRLRDSWT